MKIRKKKKTETCTKIKLLKSFHGFYRVFRQGEIFEVNKPHQVFRDDGKFIIHQRDDIYLIVEKHEFEKL